MIADITVYLSFINVIMGQLNFVHCAAYMIESQEVGIRDEQCRHMLDYMEAFFPSVIMEPTYPVWENHVPFNIQLIDSAV